MTGSDTFSLLDIALALSLKMLSLLFAQDMAPHSAATRSKLLITRVLGQIGSYLLDGRHKGLAAPIFASNTRIYGLWAL